MSAVILRASIKYLVFLAVIIITKVKAKSWNKRTSKSIQTHFKMEDLASYIDGSALEKIITKKDFLFNIPKEKSNIYYFEWEGCSDRLLRLKNKWSLLKRLPNLHIKAGGEGFVETIMNDLAGHAAVLVGSLDLEKETFAIKNVYGVYISWTMKNMFVLDKKKKNVRYVDIGPADLDKITQMYDDPTLWFFLVDPQKYEMFKKELAIHKYLLQNFQNSVQPLVVKREAVRLSYINSLDSVISQIQDKSYSFSYLGLNCASVAGKCLDYLIAQDIKDKAGFHSFEGRIVSHPGGILNKALRVAQLRGGAQVQLQQVGNFKPRHSFSFGF